MKGKETGKCDFQPRNINPHFCYGRQVAQKHVPDGEGSLQMLVQKMQVTLSCTCKVELQDVFILLELNVLPSAFSTSSKPLAPITLLSAYVSLTTLDSSHKWCHLVSVGNGDVYGMDCGDRFMDVYLYTSL